MPEDLIRTGERLLARHGIDGVSLRQIAIEAGHRNPGAVQYHFGSKEGLLRAIMEYRLPSINRRRLQLLERLRLEGREYEIKALAEPMVRPYLEVEPESHFIELEARLFGHRELHDAYLATHQYGEGTRQLHHCLDVALEQLPAPIRENRIRMAADLTLNAISQHRIVAASMEPQSISEEMFALDLFSAIVGLLTAEHLAPSLDD